MSFSKTHCTYLRAAFAVCYIYSFQLSGGVREKSCWKKRCKGVNAVKKTTTTKGSSLGLDFHLVNIISNFLNERQTDSVHETQYLH